MPDLSRDELLADVRRLKSNISRQVKVLKEMGLDAPSPATIKWEEIKESTPSNPAELDDKSLKNLHRDLKYITELKTYNKKGYTSYVDRFLPIKSYLDAISSDKRDAFWEAYSKLYNENPLRGREYKYDTFIEIADRLTIGQTPEEIVQAVIEDWREKEIEIRNEQEQGGVGRGTIIPHTRRTRNVSIPTTSRKRRKSVNSNTRIDNPRVETIKRKKRKNRRIHK